MFVFVSGVIVEDGLCDFYEGFNCLMFVVNEVVDKYVVKLVV